MARTLVRHKAGKYGIGNVHAIPLLTPPTWVHQCDLRFMVDLVSGPIEDVPLACKIATTRGVPSLESQIISGPCLLIQQCSSYRIRGTRLLGSNCRPNYSLFAGGTMSNLVGTSVHDRLSTSIYSNPISIMSPKIELVDLSASDAGHASLLGAHGRQATYLHSDPNSSVPLEIELIHVPTVDVAHACTPRAKATSEYDGVYLSQENPMASYYGAI
jgi:hypothetical protein